MHIELWEENTNKALSMAKPLNAQPNRFINQFLDAVDRDSFVQSMQKLMINEHSKIIITVEPLERKPEK